jgi:hypothetical protein
MEKFDIQGICEPTVARYFETLNAGDFQATSELFADEGVLHPPFQNPVITPPAIAAYLHKEAQGITAHPERAKLEQLTDGLTKINVIGQAKTSSFAVNAAWEFLLNSQAEITFVRLKLLASPQQLLELK